MFSISRPFIFAKGGIFFDRFTFSLEKNITLTKKKHKQTKETINLSLISL